MVDYSAYHWAKKAQYWAESIGHALIYRGSVATYADLPSSDQQIGDMYNVLADGSNYAWDGTAWDALSGIVDLSAYRTSADQDLIDAGKQPTLTTGTGINISSANVISVTSPTLTNVSTGTSSLSVLGAATVDSAATSIGVDSTAGTNGTSLGRSANSVNGGLAIGTNSKASGSWSTAIGNGNNLSNAAEATSSGSIAIGHNAHATASNAIQIFEGTNSTANSLQVKTYELLDTSTGLIPDARISTNIARTSDIKDATITITQGGVTKGSFTTNQSTADTIALDAASLPSQSGQSGKFLTTNGTTASWSVPKTNDLLDFKWKDRTTTDQNWLLSDSNWKDGTDYSNVYNHLVNDYNNAASHYYFKYSSVKYVRLPERDSVSTDVAPYCWISTNGSSEIRYTSSETPTTSDYWYRTPEGTNSGTISEVGTEIENVTTIGSYTISYYQAQDGHQICLPDQETIAQNIYDESGTCWFYILDTTNQRFKLPMVSHHGQVVERENNTNQWSVVYEDGWCEQGGYLEPTATTTTITLLKNYLSADYTITASTSYTNNNNLNCPCVAVAKNASGFSMHVSNLNYHPYWRTCGYVTQSRTNSPYKYLYFYVAG